MNIALWQEGKSIRERSPRKERDHEARSKASARLDEHKLASMATSWPSVKKVRESDHKVQEAITDYKSTQLGAILGMGFFTVTYPYYARNRKNGMGREAAMAAAWDKAWPQICLTAQVVGPSCPWPGPEIANMAKALQKPVSVMSQRDINGLIAFGKEVARDPEMKHKMVQTAIIVGAMAASDGDISSEQATAVASDVANTGARVATKRAVARGDITDQDQKEIGKSIKALSTKPTEGSQ